MTVTYVGENVEAGVADCIGAPLDQCRARTRDATSSAVRAASVATFSSLI